ncbi:Glycoside hydrolase, family 81 [Artemisia annua]|uniref:Glycoside hydrolase, family 81 n=1 Tax=Artemisia annua TaxID=35608 RepID=A0A2U1M8N8_ARTAN|nr:Glycoside hydrolase, family 81 [Artemisia annua]
MAPHTRSETGSGVNGGLPPITPANLNTTLTNLQATINQMNESINGLLIFQQHAMGELNRLSNGEGPKVAPEIAIEVAPEGVPKATTAAVTVTKIEEAVNAYYSPALMGLAYGDTHSVVFVGVLWANKRVSGLWFAPSKWKECRTGIQVLPLLPIDYQSSLRTS